MTFYTKRLSSYSKQKNTVMNTKTPQEIFREKYEDIITPLTELKITSTNTATATIVFAISFTIGILSTGNKRVGCLTIAVFVIASTIVEVRSFFKNFRYLRENEKRFLEMKSNLYHIADTKDFEEIKELTDFYDRLQWTPKKTKKALYTRELFPNFHLKKRKKSDFFLLYYIQQENYLLYTSIVQFPAGSLFALIHGFKFLTSR